MNQRPPDLEVRALGRADLGEVVAIEAESFTNPWTRAMFEEELRRGDIGRAWVARLPGMGAVGYCLGWLVAGELHISNVAIRPDVRHRGLGRRLIVAVLREAAGQGARASTLEVRRSNIAARNLYEQLGFRETGVRRHYYTDPVEDALVLWLDPLDAARLESVGGL